MSSLLSAPRHETGLTPRRSLVGHCSRWRTEHCLPICMHQGPGKGKGWQGIREDESHMRGSGTQQGRGGRRAVVGFPTATPPFWLQGWTRLGSIGSKTSEILCIACCGGSWDGDLLSHHHLSQCQTPGFCVCVCRRSGGGKLRPSRRTHRCSPVLPSPSPLSVHVVYKSHDQDNS